MTALLAPEQPSARMSGLIRWKSMPWQARPIAKS